MLWKQAPGRGVGGHVCFLRTKDDQAHTMPCVCGVHATVDRQHVCVHAIACVCSVCAVWHARYMSACRHHAVLVSVHKAKPPLRGALTTG